MAPAAADQIGAPHATATIFRAPIDQGGLWASPYVRAIGRRVQTDLAHPAVHDARILTGGQMGRSVKPAWEQELLTSETCAPNPCGQRFPGLRRNLKLHRTLRLLLLDDCACGDPFSVREITDSQFHEIARSQFAVYGEVEERRFPNSIGELQWDPDGADLF